ncbi:MAG: hypothetical protein KGL38_11825 [Gemmatimonadota bacterium]|nr:hypothetical protein [Gemmatimonadota bacterium]MDE3215333.1 hypothetical protein [Gemmatimonadota bacterium]
MNHRHLLPEEFDLLLDDEVGFGVAPLREHVQECGQCRAQLDDARLVVAALEELPQFAPSFTMADRVMAQVPVFVPWQVAALDAVRPYLPRSHAARMAAVGLMGLGGAVLTGGALWLAARGSAVSFAADVAGSRLRGVAVQAGQSAMVTLFGPSVMDTLQRGSLLGLGAIAAGFLVAAAASAFGLRAIASAARRRG